MGLQIDLPALSFFPTPANYFYFLFLPKVFNMLNYNLT